MQSKYDAQLMAIFTLIHEKTPKGKVLEKARELKNELVEAWADAQQTSNFLDSMIVRWTPDPSWISGLWIPPQIPQQAMQRIFVQPGFVSPGQRTLPLTASPERVLEIARGVIKDGMVVTGSIVNQLRSEGDQREERRITIGVGNILTGHGWKRVGKGMYKLPEGQKGNEEVKSAITQ